MRQTWSKAKVAEEIRAHVRQGDPQTNLWERNPNLYHAAKRFFGSWRKALQAIGMKPVRERWTKESVLDFIRARYASPDPRDRKHLKMHYPSQNAAQRLFGSWSAAVKAAGFQPKKCRKWSKETLLETIRRYHDQGIRPLQMRRHDPAIYNVAHRYFGSWRLALRAAGFDVQASRRWSKPKIIEMLLECHSPTGEQVQAFGAGLCWAAKQYFGSISTALQAAGLEPRERWTAARVLAAIQERHRQGRSLQKVRHEDRSLHCAARRYFGTWCNALKRADIPLAAYRKWTKETIVTAIQAHAQRGITPLEIWKADRLLKGAAKRYFADLDSALLAAGFAPASLPAKAPTCQKWDKAMIIAEIQSHHRQGLPLSTIWRQKPTLFHAATRHFGNWQDAVRAAGFPPRIVRRWSKERAIEELRAWHRVSESHIKRVDPNLAHVVPRYFGSIENAWESLGFGPLLHRWSKTRVIQNIQDGYVQGKSLQVRGFGSIPLASAANRYFGSWPNAVAAAGLPADLARPKSKRSWTPQKVIEAIQERKRQGLSMTAVWREDHGLYSQAKVRFHGWRNAMSAAGIPVQPYHKNRPRKNKNQSKTHKEHQTLP